MGITLEADLLIDGIAELATCRGAVPRRGPALGELEVIAGAAVAAAGGRIVAVGRRDEVLERISLRPDGVHVDARGGVVTPGFVDAHTHLVWAGSRADEFARILRGATYRELAAAGGGIRRTVRATRAADADELAAAAGARLDLMLRHGTTTAEAKSGYGLEVEAELKQLEVIHRLDAEHPVDLIATFLGGHLVPPEYEADRAAYVKVLVEEMIPRVAPRARYCDVFCDPSAFDPRESRLILEAGRKHGLKPRLHADEFTASGGAELAVALGAASADHLAGVSDAGLQALARSDVAAVLLPGTMYFLGEGKYAPARRLIQAGAIVALGTDCNPGSSNTESLTTVIQLACFAMRMTVEEAVQAATINSAYALDLAHDRGSVEEGKLADLVVHAVPTVADLVYHYGVNHVSTVVKRGRVVVRDRHACYADTL